MHDLEGKADARKAAFGPCPTVNRFLFGKTLNVEEGQRPHHIPKPYNQDSAVSEKHLRDQEPAVFRSGLDV